MESLIMARSAVLRGVVHLHALPSACRADLSGAYTQDLGAREITLWNYQWLLVNEHLPQIAGQAVVSDVLARGKRLSRSPPSDPRRLHRREPRRHLNTTRSRC